MSAETKLCRACNTVHPIDRFSPYLRAADGTVLRRKSQCWDCTRERKREYDRQRKERQARLMELDPVDREPIVRLPAGPLAAAIDAKAERMLRSEVDDALAVLCSRCQIDTGRLRAWRRGEAKTTPIDLADRVLLGLGMLWWEVWPPEEFPQVAAVFDVVGEPERVAA